MPFCDGGGLLAGTPAAAHQLIHRVMELAQARQAQVVELRQYQPLECLEEDDAVAASTGSRWQPVRDSDGWYLQGALAAEKVRMVAELPGDPDALMRSFGSKLRNQIRRGLKDGLTIETGGIELLDAFYDVFAENMRDLGSPVHAKRLMEAVLRAFGTHARLFVVRRGNLPLACSMGILFRDTLCNPWASSLRRYSAFAPNMLLYWAMLEYAAQQGLRRFDFGRSTRGEGSFRFKEQWGAKAEPLYWYRLARQDVERAVTPASSWGMSRAVACWKRLPVPVTRVLGPRIRRYISL
jgi:FemAB-related protein (PEP-CTERM system-associated)